MKKYFITYGDERYTKSVERTKREAEKLHIFDEVIAYSPADLGTDILNCEAMQHKRGGGYWAWKPYIICLTLQTMNEGDIVVYCDAGCTLSKGKEWQKWFQILEKYSMIGFLIHQKNEAYCRNNVINYFSGLGKYFGKLYMVSATTTTIKKTNQTIKLISEWKDLMINCPDLVLDVPPEERYLESKKLVENRHDQSIFSGLVYKYEREAQIYLQWENYENASFFKRAIVATRISDTDRRSSKKGSEYVKYYTKKILNVIYYSPMQCYWRHKNNVYLCKKIIAT
jgi:hypothetical protein